MATYTKCCCKATLFSYLSGKTDGNFFLMGGFLNEHENIFSIKISCVIFIFSSVCFILIYLTL